MLARLLIRDFVLVDSLELDFASGFGALTGETGAGKSLLIDALSFVLGERADSSLIRTGCERTEVSAEFELSDVPSVRTWLLAHDLDADNALILRRLLDQNGRSRAYLNGSPVTVQQLREVSASLLDIHGQNAHQSLLRSDAQRHLLDAHAKLLPLAAEVANAWQAWQNAQNAFDKASNNADSVAREREEVAWRVQELSSLNLANGEWERLNAEHQRLAHASSLVDGTRFVLATLSEDEPSCTAQLASALNRLHELQSYDPTLTGITQLLGSVQVELDDACTSLRRYAERLDIDPHGLQETEQRLEAVLSCARKYRLTPPELGALLEHSTARLAELGEAADLAALTAQVQATHKAYEKCAKSLSHARTKAAKQLAEEVSQQMQQLALAGGRFEIALLPVPYGSANGFEQIEFRLAGVAGNDARPLAKVASGGELSRISLAIAVVTTQAVDIPTLIFDEVDVGIGGSVAEVVGRLLRQLGDGRQVLCVTHLPQVAARANWQWKVLKQSVDGVIRSQLVMLDPTGRIEEIARMLGGVEITALTRQHAREMLELS